MEKLSSILPASPRVKSVDLDEAPPTRPGAPGFGRKVGKNTIKDKVSFSSQAREAFAKDPDKLQMNKDASRAKIVEEINKNFFENRIKPKEIPAVERDYSEMADFVGPDEVSGGAAPQASPEASESQPRRSLSIEA